MWDISEDEIQPKTYGAYIIDKHKLVIILNAE